MGHSPWKAWIASLAALRTEFGPDAAPRRRGVLAAMPSTRPAAGDLLAAHELLLFALAYRDDESVGLAVQEALRQVSYWSERLTRSGRGGLEDSGLPGTAVTAAFSFDLIEALISMSPGGLTVDWKEGSAGEQLDEVLPLLCARAETDGLLSEEISTQEWVQISSSTDDLAWYLRRLAARVPDRLVRDRIHEGLDLQVRWKPQAPWTRTWTRLPCARAFDQHDALRRHADLARELRKPIPAVAPLSTRAAREVIAACRAVLAIRTRETDPVTWACESEVYAVPLDRGVSVVILGMQPDRRLPIESYFGYVAARNGVPVAYGGGWILAGRCEIGINVFDTFRGGESSFLFTQILRTYAHLFGARTFVVDPYQIGADNPEAIDSGAYWFYDRLGFRPEQPSLAALADRERAARESDRAHRTSRRDLKRLAGSRLSCTAEGVRAAPKIDLARVGLAVSRSLALLTSGKIDLDPASAELFAARNVFGSQDGAAAHPWVARLAPLMAALPGISTWPARDRAALRRLMIDKGAARERVYAQRLAAHEPLVAALVELSSNGAAERV